MNVDHFIKREFQTINAYSGIHGIKKKLMLHSAIVVLDEDSSLPIGILTPLDIVQKTHNLVIDCISPKTALDLDCNYEKALEIMRKEQTDVLGVYKERKLEGLVFKKDLIDFITKQKNDLENKVIERTKEIKQINSSLKISKKILKSYFDSTQSVVFLVSPEYKILFFNKKASDNSKQFHQREIKVEDNIMDYIADTENNISRTFRNSFENALKGEYVIEEKEIIYTENISMWFRSEYFPVYEEDIIIGVAINITDITEKKKHELHIQKQNEILENITWTQSHGTRQPVASILGLLSIINKSELSEENKEIFNLLEITTQKLDKVIHEIIDKANSLG